MSSLDNIEFHRTAFILIPNDHLEPHKTVLIESPDKQKSRTFCTCSSRKNYADCVHAKTLETLYKNYYEHIIDKSAIDSFFCSIYFKLLEPIAKYATFSSSSLKAVHDGSNVRLVDFKNVPVISWESTKESCIRLEERMISRRFTKMNDALYFLYTDQEKALLNMGRKSQRQTTEDSVWYRFAYHLFRECPETPDFSYSVDTQTNTFLLHIKTVSCVSSISIPSKAVPDILQQLFDYSSSVFSIPIDNNRFTLFFRFCTSGTDVHIEPCIDSTESASINTCIPLSKNMIFNSLIYLDSRKTFIKPDDDSLKILASGWNAPRTIPIKELSLFIEKNISVFSIHSLNSNSEVLEQDLFSVTGADDLKRIIPAVVTSFDKMVLSPKTLANDKFKLILSFSKDNVTVDMAALAATVAKKIRFYIDNNIIYDCKSVEIRNAAAAAKKSKKDGTVTLSKAEILQFRGSTAPVEFTGNNKLIDEIRSLLDFKPIAELDPQSIYTGTLRPYQKIGVQWMLFLYDNNFGGLLCDDMGLGKTHQMLSFIAYIKEHRKKDAQILVVCPTSVMGHWQKIIETFAPSLCITLFNSQNKKSELENKVDIVITSYTIMRNHDIALSKASFDLVIYDEAHMLKNRTTASHNSASFIQAPMKMALTGTPVENKINDLKALFDLTMPGLLTKKDSSGESIDSFVDDNEYINPDFLKKVTEPFILRRLKESVLLELPPKIIDNRICSLSNDQFSSYQALLEVNATPLLNQLQDDDSDIPYMHIFALLNNMKRLCCHPALQYENPLENYERLECDKWELFKELIDECIESGQKVVVFSQYLDMIAIIDHYLTNMAIGHTVLTGSSKNRDLLVKQFAEDPECKVFVGSLKAGGVGIDLIAASVVIHYDRWWNAAKEDQATDRVHRIGQKQGVQVVKIITEGTVEEKIDKIITAKKNLANELLTEDSPDTVKVFSRLELIDLLSITK
jgi:superfamily II DNA or RNA helicase